MLNTSDCPSNSIHSFVPFRYDSWDDPDVPKFHYGSHYSSAGIVLFYLLRLPPFSTENQKLQGGQFDHADRLFNSVKDTWVSAAGKSNTSDVKELIPEFYYLPEFLENQFNLDLGEKQSGEKVYFHKIACPNLCTRLDVTIPESSGQLEVSM